MVLSEQKYRELLVDPGHITSEQFNAALTRATASKLPLEQCLVDEGVIEDTDLGRAIADGLGYLFVNLKTLRVPDEVFRELSEVAMRTHHAIIFEVTPESIKLATANPWDHTFITALEQEKGKKVEVYYTTLHAITEQLRYFKSDIGEKIREHIEVMTAHPEEAEHIVALLDQVLVYAYENHASDVHIEPLQDTVAIRFRIDGVLHPMTAYPKTLHDRVVSRIKILSRLRIDEHAIPQDGRFTFEKDTVRFGVRVSLAPVAMGENIVLRLLETQARKIPLGELGLSHGDMEKIMRGIERPYGMILAVGPTGSGKTTTLYVLLELLNKPEVNIMTIEDPIEYSITHIQQMQVNPEKELLFSTGLRSIVRQDPDIIMVGEIRDEETADIAVNAAMTGHLLLSTMHANDSATAFPRLSEIKIEPFLVASSVIVVIGQRLIRKICEQCKVTSAITKEEAGLLASDREFAQALLTASGKTALTEITLYKGMGCAVCGGTGYLDRTGIFEVLEVSDALRALIVEKAPADLIRETARVEGMTSMLEDGMTKVVQGVTTLAEVIRAIKI